jgi:hypothetical protein
MGMYLCVKAGKHPTLQTVHSPHVSFPAQVLLVQDGCTKCVSLSLGWWWKGKCGQGPWCKDALTVSPTVKVRQNSADKSDGDAG